MTQTPIINHKAVVERFLALIDPRASTKALHLEGASKLGKSHLVGTIFREIAESRNIPNALIDLRVNFLSYVDILNEIADQLGSDNFTHFKPDPPTYTINVTKIGVIGTTDTIIPEFGDRPRENDPYRLALRMCRDLKRFPGQQAIIMFDQVEEASPELQQWMRYVLEVFGRCPGLRFAFAGTFKSSGRQPGAFPERFKAKLESYWLKEVGSRNNVEEYIRYCQLRNHRIEGTDLIAIADLSNFVPGQFVEFVELWERNHGRL
ncbi:hypothetical protein [Paraburkholderia terrae]|uniref:hypothetical protein n=1 Tax=Paraburkholderia terrae TaxID=311230 RepID=UPI0012E087DF|nr:hypothetical protein [Paraburkholderia terrae]